ncbi:MAG TPA: hypothetical protein VKG92_05420 [Flavobacteriales bacterium]|nr:hypothetical protein [Flavobacteriales bacterium]
MNKILFAVLGIALTGAASAQTDPDSTRLGQGTSAVVKDSTAYMPDSVQSISFTRERIDGIERASTERTRAREERANARAASAASNSAGTSSGSGKSINRKGGSRLSLAEATDPEGRKHWTRLSKKSTRRDPDSPPGTTTVN